LNYTYTSSKDGKFGVYAADFTGHRTTDVILTQEIGGAEYPIAGLASLGPEIYPIGTRYHTYGSFATATVQQAFGQADLQKALRRQVDTFASMYLRNDGNGKFSASPLPNLAQIAPIKAIIPTDVDGDGHLDLIVAGNIYDVEANTPRADAGNGLCHGRWKGRFPTRACEREVSWLHSPWTAALVRRLRGGWCLSPIRAIRTAFGFHPSRGQSP
jgi:hypothetical protein